LFSIIHSAGTNVHCYDFTFYTPCHLSSPVKYSSSKTASPSRFYIMKTNII